MITLWWTSMDDGLTKENLMRSMIETATIIDIGEHYIILTSGAG